MKQYTIIGGVNGVGKSSFTGVLKERSTNLGCIIDVDKITAELGGNALAGGKAALKKIDACIERRVSFTQETTLSGRRTEATARQVREQGYHPFPQILNTPQNTSPVLFESCGDIGTAGGGK